MNIANMNIANNYGNDYANANAYADNSTTTNNNKKANLQKQQEQQQQQQ